MGKGFMKAVLPQETQFAVECSVVKNVITLILYCLKYSFLPPPPAFSWILQILVTTGFIKVTLIIQFLLWKAF